MFEVQWEEFPLKYIGNWTTENRHASATAALVRATSEASAHGIVHRIVERPTDLKNLTPHPIVIRRADGSDLTIAPCGVVPRVVSASIDAAPILGDIPVSIDLPGTVADLPDAVDGVALIVSGMVLAALAGSGRRDVFAPGTGPADGAIRNDKGHIVAVTRLKAVAP